MSACGWTLRDGKPCTKFAAKGAPYCDPHQRMMEAIDRENLERLGRGEPAMNPSQLVAFLTAVKRANNAARRKKPVAASAARSSSALPVAGRADQASARAAEDALMEPTLRSTPLCP